MERFGGKGNKRESRQSNGRAAGNNGFRFLLMSHLETLLFPNKSNREESAVMDCFMGFTYSRSAKKHWSFWIVSVFNSLQNYLSLTYGIKENVQRGWESAPGCATIWLPLGSSAPKANWKKLLVSDQYGKGSTEK